ncbi:MAG: VCBS repeat-containing protein [Galbibacter orientalis]|uniref:VCBS repeat-containing protein n=1 Tax=Galbibacter orientalis TaxID=453852 RepID=UPI0030018232
MIKKFLLFLIASILFSCNKEEKLFTFINPSKTIINFNNQLTNTPDLNILNYLYFYNGAGVATGDFNNDGWLDLYFTANQTNDKLYLNKQNFQFEDITELARIDNAKNWTTGVTTVDINNDGWLDIYISKVGELSNKSHNLLYINQGVDKNGVPTFKEEAKKYGLAISSYATQTTFFDYDLDGDLDMYLLNHSVHPNRTYGSGKKRNTVDSLSGDRLYRNENGFYKDVSKEAGIYQGSIGYGLGISISDINNDGYPDIYVGNDFFENDYLYLNQKNGTFKDLIAEDETKLGHTSHFSMGNDIADINNDGNADIISVDMLPEELKSFKTSGTEYNFQTYSGYLKNGYAPQFMQNALHLNNGNENFTETAYASGLSATEWSWAPLIADFDNDGNKDVYITNGILGATNDMDFISFIANENIQKRLSKGMEKEDMTFINEIPKKHVPNYFFKNNGNQTFKNTTKDWLSETPSYSNGGVYADLDNDGDLDLVVNNTNEKAFIIKNNTKEHFDSRNYLKIKFKGSDKNTFGIGAKATVYSDSLKLSAENFNTRGFMSAVAPELHFGLGTHSEIDSIRIIWADGKSEKITHPKVNVTITASHKNAQENYSYKSTNTNSYLKNVSAPLTFKHKDFTSIEFNRDPLVPFANTNQGPKTTIADINNDGLDDVFIGGAKTQSSTLLLQTKGGSFEEVQKNIFEENAINEDVDNLFFDADNDGDKDLIVVSGGNEFITGNPLSPRLYFNQNGLMMKDTLQFKNIFINASTVNAVDIDNDNDLDICITSNGIPRAFGKTPKQYIFQNDGNGSFKDISSSYAKAFQNIGNVQDAIWIDINKDNFLDLITVGHWMPISIFINDGKQLKLQKNNLGESNGWWNTLEVADFDKDGDLDLIAGNWGLNTRLKASKEEPITLYSNDFDDNGNIEPIVTYFYKGEETTFSSKDEIVKQIPMLNKKFLSYTDFANASFSELFPEEKLEAAYKKTVFELASCYFENDGNGNYTKHILPFMAQSSAIFDLQKDDFNNDGYEDILLVGNNYEISTQLGRLDALHGLLLINNKNGFFKVLENPTFDIPGPARNINKINIQDKTYYIVTINNGNPIFLEKIITP